MNLFRFPSFEVIVDYAHNTHGIEKFAEFLDATPATHKVGIVSGLGDRREQDTIDYARVAGRIFDEVILRQDQDLRGKTAEEIEALMRTGLTMDKPELPITYIENEPDAIDHVLQNAREGSVITIFTEDIKATLSKLEAFEASLKETQTQPA